MELRHLETLIAIDEEGTFTAAADRLRTVQSNVSEQIRQLEAELGVTLLARGRSGARPTESGRVVITHARRIRRELAVMHEDVAALQGLQVGSASFGIVGTASRWLVPALVADLYKRAPGIARASALPCAARSSSWRRHACSRVSIAGLSVLIDG